MDGVETCGSAALTEFQLFWAWFEKPAKISNRLSRLFRVRGLAGFIRPALDPLKHRSRVRCYLPM